MRLFRWSRLVRSVAFLALLVLIAAACGDDDSADADAADDPAAADAADDADGTDAGDDAADDSEPADAAGGGDLVVLHFEPVARSLDRNVEVELGYVYPIHQVLETLTAIDPEGQVVPLLAESWSSSDDGLAWTINIREGVEFSDGTPLTAEDVAFSLNDARRPETLYGYMFTPIDDVRAAGDLTVEIDLVQPQPLLPEALSVYAASIIQADFGGLDADAYWSNPIGTGPFVIDTGSYVPGESITVVKNDSYWRDGLPLLDSVTFRSVADENQRILQVQAGNAHIASFPDPSLAVLALEDSDEIDLRLIPSYQYLFAFLNTAHEPLGDVHARRAIIHSIDTQGIVDGVLFGEGSPGTAFLAPGLPYVADSVLEFGTDAARAELDQSAFSDGFSLEILASGGAGTQESIAQLIASQLGEIGIDSEIILIDEGSKFERVLAKDYHLVLQGWGQVSGDPHEMIAAAVDPIFDGMFTGYLDPALQELASAAQSELDEDTREELYVQLQQDVQSAAFSVPIFHGTAPWTVSSTVSGVEFSLASRPDFTQASLAG